MTVFLVLVIIVLTAALVVVTASLVRERETRKQRGLFKPWPIPKSDPDVLSPRFATGVMGPDRDTEIRFVANFRVPGGISDFETWVLCVLARDAERIFEFGTATGKTAWLLAANAPEAEITTLTLKPELADGYKAAAGDDAPAEQAAMMESFASGFWYEGTPEAARITQLFGDSKAFDETPYRDAFDLIFVDGAHALSYVRSDSAKAMAMVRPGGVVLWHDYRGPRRVPGVFQALNELARAHSLVHIKGTALVAWRRPG